MRKHASKPQPPKVATQVSEAVQKARQRAGLSQVELAAKIGTRQGAVTRLENGPHNATIGTLEKIARATGCELEVRLRPRKVA